MGGMLRGSVVVVVALTVIVGMMGAVECSSRLKKEHERWMSKHGRVYSHAAEKQKRLHIFNQNLNFIHRFNSNPNHSFTLSPNAFADMTNAEFRAAHLSTSQFRPPNNNNNHTSKVNDDSDSESESESDFEGCDAPPSSVDWRQQGAVNPIRDQGSCSVCWAFATLAAVESMTFIKKGTLPSLSVEQLVDCVYASQGRAGCHTGYGQDAYDYIIHNGGVTSESNYPFNPNKYYYYSRSTCDNSLPPAATISGFSSVPHNDESALQLAVAAQPVVVQLTAGSREFQFYSGGLFTGECGSEINHMATMVGYGTTQDGKDYWLLRNQWGQGWGEAGYVRLLRNSGIPGGHCQILTDPTFPY